MDGPIDVIRFRQQQEDPKFLAHFGGKFIIHWVRLCTCTFVPTNIIYTGNDYDQYTIY